MSDQRSEIFGAVRRALKVSGSDEDRRARVAARLSEHGRNLVPTRSNGDQTMQIALFRKMAERVQASIDEIQDMAQVPDAVAAYLKAHNLPPQVKVAPAADLIDLDWATQPLLEVAFGTADEPDPVSVTRALAGAAETGTLVLSSGPESPVTLNFLPETHIVVLRRDEVVGPYEEAFDRLRAQLGEGVMPRTVNMITGPSRTADIEQRIELGAHGPKRLHVILVGGAPGDER